MNKLPIALTEEEFVALCKVDKNKHHRVSYVLGYFSGLRISEVVNLKPEDINIQGKSIFISQGKGKNDRVVPLPKYFKEVMLKEIPMKCGVRALQKAFKIAATKTGLKQIKPDVSFHSLRHSFATRCVHAGMPIDHVRTLLGHASISTTNVYLKANPKEALSKYEELF